MPDRKPKNLENKKYRSELLQGMTFFISSHQLKNVGAIL
jgi:hypothetical protein